MAPKPTTLSAALVADEGFRAEFLAAGSHEQAVEIAAQNGWTVGAGEIEGIVDALTKSSGRELSDAELEQVSGGVGNIWKTKHETVKNSISNVR